MTLSLPHPDYGSHYSSAGTVMFYLIRLEPFTAMNRALQVLLGHSMRSRQCSRRGALGGWGSGRLCVGASLGGANV